jgi:antitoxin YefM
MNAIAYTAVCGNLTAMMDQVGADREPVIITRHRKPAIVMVSLDDYNALDETANLSPSSKYAARLLASRPGFSAGERRARK